MTIKLTYHAIERMKQRTPFEEQYFTKIATFAYAKGTAGSNVIERQFLRKKEHDSRTLKIYNNFIYIFDGNETEKYLITVYPYDEIWGNKKIKMSLMYR